MKQPSERIRLFTDGACSGNPGPGGWAYIAERVNTGERRQASGGVVITTNNQMELLAVIEGLKTVKPGVAVELVTDSEYVGKGITTWLPGWVRKGWMTANKQPVKNRALWEDLHRLLSERSVTVTLVRGHSGHPENEACDELARAEVERAKS